MYLRRTTLGLLAALLTACLAVVAAWAGFTGPNRTTTKEVRDYANDVWTCTRSGQSCEFAAGKPDCRNHPSTGSQQGVCGWVATNCGCEKAYKEKTTTEPPATVSGSFDCSEQGEDGWCRDGASLELSAAEPLGGQVIQAIEGDPGGVLCDPADGASVDCSWSGGGQGEFTVEFWAVSSYGDTSEKASSPWKLDSQAPSVELSLDGGEMGGGGWYRDGTVTASASGSDSVSGVAEEQVSLEGGDWQGSVKIDDDGVHEVRAKVTDRAGNSAEEADEVRYDGSPPSVDGSFSGTQGDNGWYTSSVSASVSASDNLSGVGSAEVSVDGGGWKGSPAQISGDGTHKASFRATDVAGNQATEGESTIRIDASPPHSDFRTPQEGTETWISGEFTFEGESSDATSGLAGVELSLNGGGSWQSLGGSGDWSYAWDTRSVPNGTYTILARGRDVAGNRESTARVTVRVDNVAPLVDIPDAWTLGDYAPLTVTEQDIGLDRVEIQISGSGGSMGSWRYDPAAVPAAVDWDGQISAGEAAPAGEYAVTAVAWDLAGNRGSDSGTLTIPEAALPELPEILEIFNPQPQAAAAAIPLAAGPGGSEPASITTAPVASEAQAIDFRRIWIWPAFAWAGLLAAVGYAKLSDPRPEALRGLRSDLRRIRKLQS
ncbi:MAG TPA: Ig-like domain-containing protein [Anaerolineales bacterium]